MPDPTIAQRFPYVIDEQPGNKAWCSCGDSKTQPYCDGSHRGTEFRPVKFELTEAKKIAWCGCKHSANQPHCDGSHRNLPS